MLHTSFIFETGLHGFNISDGNVINRKTALPKSYILSISASPPQEPKPRTEPKAKKELQGPRKHGLSKSSKHTLKFSHSSPSTLVVCIIGPLIRRRWAWNRSSRARKRLSNLNRGHRERWWRRTGVGLWSDGVEAKRCKWKGKETR